MLEELQTIGRAGSAVECTRDGRAAQRGRSQDWVVLQPVGPGIAVAGIVCVDTDSPLQADTDGAVVVDAVAENGVVQRGAGFDAHAVVAVEGDGVARPGGRAADLIACGTGTNINTLPGVSKIGRAVGAYPDQVALNRSVGGGALNPYSVALLEMTLPAPEAVPPMVPSAEFWIRNPD